MLAAAILAVLPMSGCSGTDATPAGGGVLTPPPFIVDINNQWVVDGDPDHTFSLQSDAGEASSGIITGEESFEGQISDLNGSYDNRQVEFTVERDGGADPVDFSGVFEDENTITLTSGSESFTLRREVF